MDENEIPIIRQREREREIGEFGRTEALKSNVN